ncbi:HEPN domain-containing protein [Gemmobacter megaterium]|uniref:HEPN domain-containing protein n=1 Tax=Gemmobacter megaterium TaxID=1086013 RepID=A0A1N7L323_9RHOB|nr:hypothetical protein [Gemmobacter megaterium]GGE05305.1 hypothetical protein GCM10011345_08560 [Gemmobacter megaterium]SIS68201.1 HEPN domain-containing protein [Gemmobacter megaterium]
MTDERAHPGQTVKISPEQQRESGLLFFRSGNQYRKAAIDGAEKYRDPLAAFKEAEGWATIHDPVCNLLGHAAELYLKAFLIAKGVPVTDLAKKPFGHDLGNLCKEAVSRGLVLDAEYAEGLTEFARDYGMAPYTFRYPDIGRRKLNFPDLLIEMIDALRDAAFDTVNQKARSLGTPIGPS